jgi:hypothetical protein
VNRTPLSGRAMLAPSPRRLGEFRERIDFAAERASATFASWRGGIGRNDYGGGGHSNVSLGQVDELDGYRDKPLLAS